MRLGAYAGGGRNLVAGFANQASFSFQGRIIGIAGGAARSEHASQRHNQKQGG